MEAQRKNEAVREGCLEEETFEMSFEGTYPAKGNSMYKGTAVRQSLGVSRREHVEGDCGKGS